MAETHYFNLEELKRIIPRGQIENYKKLQYLIMQENPKIAVHDDPDGIISGILLKNHFNDMNPIIIPISYRNLRISEIKRVLSKVNWFCVADLPPFNIETCEYYFDHHISSKNQKILAKNIFYKPDLPSAAKVIIDCLNIKDKKLIHLSEIASICDQGNLAKGESIIKMELPTTIIEEAWLLEDIIFSQRTLEDLLEIIDFVDKNREIKSLFSIYETKIAKYRQKRKESIELVKEIDCNDIVILIITSNRYNTVSIVNEIRKKNTKVILAFVKRSKSKYNLIARHGYNINNSEKLILRLDTLTENFGGGGHISAAGAQIDDFIQALNKIEKWAKDVKLKITIYSLKDKDLEEIN